MHHINMNNKREQVIRLFLSYVVIAMVLILATYALVLVAAGYDIDRRTGEVIQNGVLLLETDPEEADVYLNGMLENDKTSSRFALPQGDYNIRLEKSEYRTWQSDVEISGSQVSWLYYPQLIPNTIETSNLGVVAGLDFFEINDKADQIALHSSKTLSEISIYNLNDKEIVANKLTLPTKLFELDDEDEVVGAIRFVEWSSNAEFMLLEYVHGEKSEFLVIDVNNPNRSINVDAALGFMIDEIFFGPRNNDVYVLHAGLMRRFDKSAGTSSSLLFEDVVQFGVEDQDVWVLKTGIEEGRNGVYRLGREAEPLIELDKSEQKTMLTSNYEAKPKIALVGDQTIELYGTIRNEAELNVPEKVIKFTDPGAKIEFSPHGRFLSVSQSNNTLVYDLETKREHSITVESVGILGWLDAQRLYFSKDSQLYIVDFNGDNTYQIAGFDSSWPAYVDEGEDAVFTIGTQNVSKELILRRSQITLDQ